MKALIVTTGHQIEVREISKPQPGPYEALVKILACGICGTTDRELIKGTQPFNKDYPAVLGHEAVGEVVQVGAKVKTFRVGDWVTRPVGIWPGESRDGLFSAWGGFAEFGVVRDRKAMAADGDTRLEGDYTALRQNVVPKGVPIEDAVLAISLAETSSWFSHAPAVGGKCVAVSGTGIAGLSVALWAKLAGARKVIVLGRRSERLALACDIAADHGVNVTATADVAAEVKRLTGGQGVDLFVEAVGGRDQIRLGLGALAFGGTIAIYGVPPGQIHELNWSWNAAGKAQIATYPADEHLNFAWAIDMLRRGYVPGRKLLTHRRPLAEAREAFADVDAGKVVKGMLVMA
jgi:2-desacetyl-2-hydroxyethyl bacteriochlorophyllide A dehydrogenase